MRDHKRCIAKTKLASEIIYLIHSHGNDINLINLLAEVIYLIMSSSADTNCEKQRFISQIVECVYFQIIKDAKFDAICDHIEEDCEHKCE